MYHYLPSHNSALFIITIGSASISVSQTLITNYRECSVRMVEGTQYGVNIKNVGASHPPRQPLQTYVKG